MAITTIYTYPLNGTQRDFTIPFEYLARRFVVLTLIGTDRKELVLTTDYRFTSKTNVQTNVPWGPADGYERIEIRRNTSATDRLVDFADGSILRASELNTSQVQTLHVAEEARNMVADTISTNQDGDLDARGRRLVNLADAVSPDHAVTLRQEQAWAQSTLGNRNASEAAAALAASSKAASKTSETNSKASEIAAKTSETNSKASEIAAKTSETNSKASEIAAKTSETNSKASEIAAKTSETNSKASEIAAKTSETSASMHAANLGSAVSLYSKVQAVSGLEVQWAPGVYHKMGATSYKERVIDLGGLQGYYNGLLTINATQPWLIFQAGSVNAGAVTVNSSGAILLTAYSAEGAAVANMSFSRTGNLSAPSISTPGGISSNGRYAIVGSTSPWVPLVAAGSSPLGKVRLAHSLGKRAFGYQLEYKCVVGDAGYVVGDIISPVDTNYHASSTAARGGHLLYIDDNTADYLAGGTGVVLIHKTSGAAMTMTMTSWQVRCTALGMSA